VCVCVAEPNQKRQRRCDASHTNFAHITPRTHRRRQRGRDNTRASDRDRDGDGDDDADRERNETDTETDAYTIGTQICVAHTCVTHICVTHMCVAYACGIHVCDIVCVVWFMTDVLCDLFHICCIAHSYVIHKKGIAWHTRILRMNLTTHTNVLYDKYVMDHMTRTKKEITRHTRMCRMNPTTHRNVLYITYMIHSSNKMHDTTHTNGQNESLTIHSNALRSIWGHAVDLNQNKINTYGQWK